MNAYLRWLTRHPFVVLAANLVLTLVLGSYAIGVRTENVLENVLPAGDPAIAYYEQIRQTFGSDNVAVVGVLADNALTASTLVKIKRLTDAIGRIEGVERVLSITNALDPAEDVFTPPPLVPRIPPSPAEIERLRQKLRDLPLYRKNLVSEDFAGAAINVFFAMGSQSRYRKLDIDHKIQALIEAEPGPERIYYTGAAHLQEAALALMRRDLVSFTPLALFIALAVLSASFRSTRGVLLPLGAVVLALVWTLGVMGIAGKALTIGTFVLPALILVIGSASSMHVMSRYYEQANVVVAAKEHTGDTVKLAMQRVWVPLLISTLTTAIGFGALSVSSIPAIRDLGIFAVVGMIALGLSTLSFLPAALQLLGVGERGTRSAAAEQARLARLLTRVGRRAYDSRRMILNASVALVLVALVGADRIHVDSDVLGYFEQDSPVRQANEIINRDIVGTGPFYLIVEGARPGQLLEWHVLRRIKRLQAFVEGLPGVSTTVSLVDYLELLEAGLNKSGGGDLIVDEQGRLVPAKKPVPFWEDPKNLEPVLEMVRMSPGTFSRVISGDFGKMNILVRTQMSGSRAIEATLAKIRDYIDERFPAELRVRPTGTLVLFTGTSSEIVKGQVRSLTLALAVIFVVMALMFLSVKVGALAVLPNLLSITFFFGLMGWAGVVLNLGTSLIATIALGLAVDATIHYMARLNLELKNEDSQRQAVVRALRTVGRPIVYTTVGLCLGFAILGLSNFVPVQQFGLLTSLTLACAMACNVLVLPALLATTKIITLWDLVNVRLGENPASTIPLFGGLRPAQARIVVLMGEMKRFEPNENIVRQGEESDAMFVVINGTAEVWAGSGTERRPIATQRRGDVFGEMGLVRHTVRSADVVAVEPVELLAVDNRFLDRIQKRYPRIAAKVFLNLSRILSDRLQRMTDQFVSTSQLEPVQEKKPA
jgi:predicted RND superfamily exporter protein